MFGDLTQKLDSFLRAIRGAGTLSEQNIRESLKEVRSALLDADVSFDVVTNFIAAVESKAVGEKTLKSIEPGQQVVKIVYEELVETLGRTFVPLTAPTNAPTIYLLCGLQGAGKTTLAAKLALQAKGKKNKVLLVAADIYRPAAIKQLQTLGEQIGVEVFFQDGEKPAAICKAAKKYAERNFVDLLIFDTAGRLQIDTELMNELAQIKSDTKPHEILLVVDAMTGQVAVEVAQEFHRRLQLTGVALSKLDGDARGGAAISIRATTNCPIKIASVGEKLGDLEQFHPNRMASRILGMGDVVTLVEKAQASVDLTQAAKMQEKLLKNKFDLDDFLEQLKALRNMGSLESVLGMIPGVGAKLKSSELDPKALGRVEAMILSMTREERRNPKILNGSRRRRIAAGSGTSVPELNQLLKQFEAMSHMIKTMQSSNNKKGKNAGMARAMLQRMSAGS